MPKHEPLTFTPLPLGGIVREAKGSNGLLYRRVPVFGFKAVSTDPEQPGLVECYVSITDVEDDVADVIHAGAYAKTLRERIPKGVWSHDWDTWVSKTLEAREVQPGSADLPMEVKGLGGGALYIKTLFNLNTTAGKDAYENVKFFSEEPGGNQVEWSIGYNVPPGGATYDQKSGVRHIKELELYEYSPVLFGAMPLATTLSVKSMNARIHTKTKWTAEARSAALDKGHALPPKEKGGQPRFPIEDASDVEDAVGLAKTDEERKHVIEQADRLGASDKIPDTWNKDGSKTDGKVLRIPVQSKAARLFAQVKAGGDDSAQHLIDWFNDGADGQIDWGSDGDFDQCVDVASNHMDAESAKGFCNLRHQDAVGGAPGSEGKGIEPAAAKGFLLAWATATKDVAPSNGEGTLHYLSATDVRQIEVGCPNCGNTVTLTPGADGSADCPECGHVLQLPDAPKRRGTKATDAYGETPELGGGTRSTGDQTALDDGANGEGNTGRMTEPGKPQGDGIADSDDPAHVHVRVTTNTPNVQVHLHDSQDNVTTLPISRATGDQQAMTAPGAKAADGPAGFQVVLGMKSLSPGTRLAVQGDLGQITDIALNRASGDTHVVTATAGEGTVAGQTWKALHGTKTWGQVLAETKDVMAEPPKGSYEEFQDDVREAVERTDVAGHGSSVWLVATYDDRVVAEVWDWDDWYDDGDDNLYEFTISRDDQGRIVLGDPVPVELQAIVVPKALRVAMQHKRALIVAQALMDAKTPEAKAAFSTMLRNGLETKARKPKSSRAQEGAGADGKASLTEAELLEFEHLAIGGAPLR